MPSRPTSTPVQQDINLNADELRRGVDRLKKRIAEVQAFEPSSVVDQYDIPSIKALKAAIEETLARIFGADTPSYKRFKNAAHFDNGPFNYAYEVPIGQVRQSLTRSKNQSLALLNQAIAVLIERLEELDESGFQSKLPDFQPALTRVFIVHGHDDAMKEAVARFIDQIGFEPIILHEQPNQGRTIIEKFEAHSSVGFAVILLTPDDQGCENGGVLKPRARQNVVFELGYFAGALGRKNVLALSKGSVEIPSDFSGVIYQDFDPAGAWRAVLGKELQAAGFEIDWNKVMR